VLQGVPTPPSLPGPSLVDLRWLRPAWTPRVDQAPAAAGVEAASAVQVERAAPSVVVGARPPLTTVAGHRRVDVAPGPAEAKAELMEALGQGGVDVLQAALTRIDRATLRALGDDAELRRAVARAVGGRVMADVVRRMDLPPDTAQRWLREAGVFTVAPGPLGRPLSDAAGAAMSALEDHAEAYRALLALERVEQGGVGPGGFADPVALVAAQREADRARVAAGLGDLQGLREAEAQLLAVFTAEAARVSDALLDGSLAQLRAVDVNDPRLHAWLDALRDGGLGEVTLADLQAVMPQHFPVLGARDLDYLALAHAEPSARRRMLRAAITRSAEAVEALRGQLRADSRLAFIIPGVREATLQSLGAPEGSVLRDAVGAETDRLLRDQHFAQLAETVMAGLLTGLAGLLPLAAATASVALSARSVEQGVTRHAQAAAARDARLDGALALEAGDPAAFWIALDVAGLIVDAAAVVNVARAARAVARGAASSKLQDALHALPEGAVTDVERFGQQVQRAAQAAAEDRRLQAVHPELIAQLAAVAPGLQAPELLGLARLGPDAAWAVTDALLYAPGALAQVARSARQPGVAAGIQTLVAGPGGAATLAALFTRRGGDAARSLMRLGQAPEAHRDRVLHALRGPPSARAAGLVAAVEAHAPLDGAATVALAQRLGAPITPDPGLAGRGVEVRYATREGRVTEISLAVGPEATEQDVLHHAEVVRDLLRYRGLQGRLRLSLGELQARLGHTLAPPGTAAFEARREVEKLQRMLAAENRVELPALKGRIASLQRQVDAQRARLDEHPLTVGQLRIAAEDPSAEARRTIDALAPSLWPGLELRHVGRDVQINGVLTVRAEALAQILHDAPDQAALWQPTLQAMAAQGPRALELRWLPDLHRAVALRLAGAEEGIARLRALPADLEPLAGQIVRARRQGNDVRALPASLPASAPLRAALAPLLDQVGGRFTEARVQKVVDLAWALNQERPEALATLTQDLRRVRTEADLARVTHAAERRLAHDALLKGALPQPLVDEAVRLLGALERRPDLDPDSLTATFGHLATRTVEAHAQGALAELNHAQRRLTSGALRPGTRAYMGVENFALQSKTPVTVEFGPGDHYVFGGHGLPAEADLLYRGVDGLIHLEEVKANAHALLNAVDKAMNPTKAGKASRKYLQELQNFAKGAGQRATIVLASGDQFWEMMFTVVDKAKSMTLGELLVATSPKVDFVVAGRALSNTEFAALLQRAKAALKSRPAGMSSVSFLKTNLPTFAALEAQP
jgi:hypothetical protein